MKEIKGMGTSLQNVEARMPAFSAMQDDILQLKTSMFSHQRLSASEIS